MHISGFTPASARVLVGETPAHKDMRLVVAMSEAIVVTATRTDRRVEEVPVRTELISSQLATLAPRTLADAVEFTTGVRVESNCQNCNFSQVRLLGLEGAYTQILIDSQPLMSSLAQVYGIEQIPGPLLERVEAVKGGGSALYGPGSVGGGVNVIPREARRSGGSFEIRERQRALSDRRPGEPLHGPPHRLLVCPALERNARGRTARLRPLHRHDLRQHRHLPTVTTGRSPRASRSWPGPGSTGTRNSRQRSCRPASRSCGRPTRRSTLRASVACGFRAPVVFDEDLHILAASGETVVIYPGEDLSPETSTNLMAGFEWRPRIGRGQGLLELNGFHTPLHDLFFNVEDDDPTTPQLELFLGMRYTGTMLVPHYAGYIEEDRLETTQSIVTFDVHLGRTFKVRDRSSLNLRLMARNLTDAFQPDLDLGPDRDSGYVYGPRFPRRIEVSLGMSF